MGKRGDNGWMVHALSSPDIIVAYDVQSTRPFYKAQNRGFTEAEFRNVCERIAGVPLDEYFDYANTVKPPDYKKYFAYAGLDIETGDGSFRLTPLPKLNPLQEKILRDWLR